MLWAGNFVSSQGQAGLTRLSFPDKALTICPYLTLFSDPQIPAHMKRREILCDLISPDNKYFLRQLDEILLQSFYRNLKLSSSNFKLSSTMTKADTE